MKRKLAWAVGVLLVLVVVHGVMLSSSVQYRLGDELQKVDILTKRKLAAYERTKDPVEIRNWLIGEYSTEGTGMQMYMTLENWSFSHQKEFVSLVESFPKADRKHFIKLFSFTLVDSNDKDQFRRAFKDYSSLVIDEIKK